jgi:hypothetical protein
MSALGQKADICSAKRHVRFTPKSGHSSAWCEPGHAGLVCPGLESGGAAQESCVMLLRPQFNHYCEVVGRASALVAFVTMALLILAAIAVDVLR